MRCDREGLWSECVSHGVKGSREGAQKSRLAVGQTFGRCLGAACMSDWVLTCEPAAHTSSSCCCSSQRSSHQKGCTDHQYTNHTTTQIILPPWLLLLLLSAAAWASTLLHRRQQLPAFV